MRYTSKLFNPETARSWPIFLHPEKASSLVTFALGSVLAGFLLGVGMTVGES